MSQKNDGSNVFTGVYYAHPMSMYGTDEEKRNMEWLEAIFREATVYNPSDKKWDTQWAKHGMKTFDKFFLPKIQCIVFQGYPNGAIGSGVAWELKALKARDKIYTNIYELRKIQVPLPKLAIGIEKDIQWVNPLDGWDSIRRRFEGRYRTRMLNLRYGK